MKDDIDTRFEGGPYNGNSFVVSADRTSYEIASSSATHSTVHVYTRIGDKFIYERTDTHDGPE